MKALALLCFIPGLAIGANASVSGGKPGGLPASPQAPSTQSASNGHGGSTGIQEIDPRQAPPLDPKREVTQQDCTHPVDLTKGNLKCK